MVEVPLLGGAGSKPRVSTLRMAMVNSLAKMIGGRYSHMFMGSSSFCRRRLTMETWSFTLSCAYHKAYITCCQSYFPGTVQAFMN